jgi:CheY-like chemotaxis protein
MSNPQPKLSDYTEFSPKKEQRRAPLPITNLPVNAISEDVDPTLEIRTLIEQLQQTARDARAQTRAVEQDRDGLTHELARAEQQLEAMRENERELRSHFVEITSLIKERDAAIDESDRRAQALADASRKLEGAERERNDAQRQRDEAVRLRDDTVRKFEAYNRATDEQARLIGETQKQILTIRQARDAAHGQILDLTNKLSRAEDQIADLEYQLETAEKATKSQAAEAADYRRQLDAATLDRDATARQVEDLSRELDEQRKKLLDLAEQKSAVLQADSEHTLALAEARGQVLSIGQERDTARGRAQELTKELEDLRVQFQKFRDEEVQQSTQALAEAQEKLTALETQARESRHGAKNLTQELTSVHEQLTALQARSDEGSAREAEAGRQLEAITGERDAALTSLNAAQKQIDYIIRERDTQRELSTQNALELDAQLTALRAQVQAMDSVSEEAKHRQDDLKQLQKRFEKQRVETIDLAAQLQTAQREIRELSANLAEARLQVKFATAAGRATKGGATKSDFAGIVAASASPAAREPAAALAVVPAPVMEEIPAERTIVVGGEDTLSDREAKSALSAMRHCFQSFTRTPTDLSLLNELHCHVHGFSDRARATGFLAIHRLCAAFAEMTRGLYEVPEQLNPSTLRTVNQTIEFLAALMKDGLFAQAQDPAKAVIHAVDDDRGNGEAIKMAMETASMRTDTAQDPALALSELANSRYDLIFLDVALPGMDGFELCKHIRELPLHQTTPVIFLTGIATLENRVQSSLSGGSDFIGKPFNLHELSVKAMTIILKSQLQMA